MATDTLSITLSGLPHQNRTVRNVGVGIGIVILALGFWAAFRRDPAADESAALLKRKEKLLADLVALEEQHRQGRSDERRYASRRQSLVSQLERVMGEIDGLPASPRPRAGGPGSGLAA